MPELLIRVGLDDTETMYYIHHCLYSRAFPVCALHLLLAFIMMSL